MDIIKLEINPKKPKFVNLILSNGKKYTIYKEVVTKFGLRKKDKLSETKLSDILFQAEFYRAKDLALKYFSYRKRTEFELRKKLSNHNINQKVYNSVIENLKSIGLINDREFAMDFIKTVLNKKPVGKILLKQKLLQKGIDKNIIDEVIEKTYKCLDEKERALHVAKIQLKKYQKSKKKYNEKRNQAKLASFLSYRGYNWDVISYVMKRIFKTELCEE